MTTQQPGGEIAGYRIESLIGRGGMAVVYRAEDLRLGRKVALKLLSPQLADNEEFRQRFIRESRLAASLDHPNIVPIYEAGEADGQLFIAMRYVIGSDLKGLLTEAGPLPDDRTLRLISQIGDALDAAHGAGLVHRDVKPANVLVAAASESGRSASSGHVYLTDFGLTKRTAEMSGGLTGTGHFLGTVDYVSPEQIQGKQAGPATDVYALGCVLYECLTGQLPYRRDDDAALLWAHLVEPPPPVTAIRPELPGAVNVVVTRAMAKDPVDRYQSCRELVDELEHALRMAAPESPKTGRHAAAGGAAIRTAGLEPDGSGPDLETGLSAVPGGRHHVTGPVVPLATEVHASSEGAPADDQPDLEKKAPSDQEDDARDHEEQDSPSSAPAILTGPTPVGAVAGPRPSVSTRTPRPAGSQRRRLVARIVIVATLVLVMGAGAVAVRKLLGVGPVTATAVVAEPAQSYGDYPFTDPPTSGGVTLGSAEQSRTAAPDGSNPPGSRTAGVGQTVASNSVVPVSGATMGLYGGTGAQACNTELMATFLEAHPDKAAAWAGAQHIETGEIRRFLKSLTPVVLRTDTAVTNHGFVNGKAKAFQAVLQAGTAVLVDERGAPRVRCACGNPLKQPAALERVRYTGQKWPELQQRPVTVIRPATVIIQHFVVVVVQRDTSVVRDRPRGTEGTQDRAVTPDVADKALEFSVNDPAGAKSSTGTSHRAGSTDDPGSVSSSVQSTRTSTTAPSTTAPSTTPPSTTPPSTTPPSTTPPSTTPPSTTPPSTTEPPSPTTEPPPTSTPPSFV